MQFAENHECRFSGSFGSHRRTIHFWHTGARRSTPADPRPPAVAHCRQNQPEDADGPDRAPPADAVPVPSAGASTVLVGEAGETGTAVAGVTETVVVSDPGEPFCMPTG